MNLVKLETYPEYLYCTRFIGVAATIIRVFGTSGYDIEGQESETDFLTILLINEINKIYEVSQSMLHNIQMLISYD